MEKVRHGVAGSKIDIFSRHRLDLWLRLRLSSWRLIMTPLAVCGWVSFLAGLPALHRRPVCRLNDEATPSLHRLHHLHVTIPLHAGLSAELVTVTLLGGLRGQVELVIFIGKGAFCRF